MHSRQPRPAISINSRSRTTSNSSRLAYTTVKLYCRVISAFRRHREVGLLPSPQQRTTVTKLATINATSAWKLSDCKSVALREARRGGQKPPRSDDSDTLDRAYDECLPDALYNTIQYSFIMSSKNAA